MTGGPANPVWSIVALKLPAQFGKYVLLDLIARGGMAEVYRAKARAEIGGFERLYAIKRILPELNENREFIESLINEAKITVTLSHSNIAQVYDLGKVEDTYYLAMEFVHGRDLHGRMLEMEHKGQPIPFEHAIWICMSMLAGLDVAHRKRDQSGRPLNIVHRDISPHNVLLSYGGEVKIIDFGIARAANKLGVTRRGVIKGKLLFMAPEQARADPIDHRVDLFAVGMTLYRMLTGVLPFDAANQYDIYRKVVECRIPNPKRFAPDLPDDLAEVMRVALQRDPALRYQDAYEFRSQLERCLVRTSAGYGQDTFRAFVEEHFGSPPLPDDPPDSVTQDLPQVEGSSIVMAAAPIWAAGLADVLPPSQEPEPEAEPFDNAIREFEEKPTIQRFDAPSPEEVEAYVRKHRGKKPIVRSNVLLEWLFPTVLGLFVAAIMALLTWAVFLE